MVKQPHLTASVGRHHLQSAYVTVPPLTPYHPSTMTFHRRSVCVWPVVVQVPAATQAVLGDRQSEYLTCV